MKTRELLLGNKKSWITTALTIIAMFVTVLFGASVYGLAITDCVVETLESYMIEGLIGTILVINLTVQVTKLYNNK